MIKLGDRRRQRLLGLSEIDGDAALVEIGLPEDTLNSIGMPVDAFTIALILSQAMGGVEAILDHKFEHTFIIPGGTPIVN